LQNRGAGEESRTLDLNLGKVALYQLSYSRIGVLLLAVKPGAGEESRTLDLNLGKVALYQLSYSRMESYILLSLTRQSRATVILSISFMILKIRMVETLYEFFIK
jgi:hypothetical protein